MEMWNLQMVTGLILTIFWPQSPVATFDSIKFLTDASYKDNVLDTRPFATRELRTLQQCQALCAYRPSCKAFAFGGLCVTQCRLYDSNICVNSSLRTSKQKSFTIWDKVAFKANFSCITDSTFKACLKSQYVRCGACKRTGFHGPNCEYAARGCPIKYEFHNGSCSYVTNAKVNFDSVTSNCLANSGGRFGLVHNVFDNSMLMAWSQKLGLTDGVYIGIEMSGNGWMRKDGQLLTAEGIYNNWGLPDEPSQSVQSSVVMDKDMDFNYNDEMDFVLRSFFCEIAAENCTAFPMQVNATDGTCYNLHQQKMNFSNAMVACGWDNGTLTKVRDLETHEMLADFLRQIKFKDSPYVGILSSKDALYNGTYYDGTPVNFELPWQEGQPNYSKENVVVLTNNGKWSDILSKLLNGYFCEYIAKSCSQWRMYRLREDGLYRLLPSGTLVDFTVQCDMTSMGGGWTIIQRRSGDANVNFNATFAEYRTGFGNLSSDFWLGLDKISLLTTQEAVHLRIDMVDINNVSTTVLYSGFKVVPGNGTNQNSYTSSMGLIVTNRKGNNKVTDGVVALNGTVFNAYDTVGQSCASTSGGGWFFQEKTCGNTNLNGFYPGSSKSSNDSVMQWSGTPLTRVQMKIKTSVDFINFKNKQFREGKTLYDN